MSRLQRNTTKPRYGCKIISLSWPKAALLELQEEVGHSTGSGGGIVPGSPPPRCMHTQDYMSARESILYKFARAGSMADIAVPRYGAAVRAPLTAACKPLLASAYTSRM